MIGLLTMLVATAALAYAALVAARRIRGRRDTALEHALTVALFLAVGILVASLLVGLPGLYRPVPLALASVVLALAARITLGGLERGRDGASLRGRTRRLARLAATEPLAAAAVALAGVALLNRAVTALVLPPGGFDSIAYHLVFVGEWVRRGSLGRSDLQEATCCAWYPVNAELTYAWLAVFPHSDRLVGISQVGYLGVGALATAGIALSVGASGRWAVVAGSLFALTPVALRQSSISYTDVALAAAVLVMAAFMLRLLRADARPADVLRFALAAGFALGVKGTAVPYVAAACVLVAASAVVRRARGRGSAPSVGSIVRAGAVVAVLLVLGSGWYFRAWAETGNPLWPFRMEAFGHVVFEGTKDPAGANPTPPSIESLASALEAPASWAADLDVAASMRTDLPRDEARLGGLGLTWLLLGIPSIVAALALRRRDWRFGAFALAVALPALVAMPDAWWSRFTIPLAAVGTVALALVLTQLPLAAARAVTAVALALALIGVVTTRPLGPLGELRRTPGAPLNRPPAHPDEFDYAALEALPERARVGVLPGSPLLPYLVLGERFSREAVPLPRRQDPVALARAVHEARLEYVVSRAPLPDALARAGGLELTASSSGAVVYRTEPTRTPPSEPGDGP